MNAEFETPQNHEHGKKCRHGIITRILGPMPRWLSLAFQVGALATLTLFTLTIIGGLIAAILTGNFEAVVAVIKALVPDSILGGL